MSLYSIQDTTLTDIADAIRSKTGKTASMTPAEMVDEIENISGGGASTLTTKTITLNGTYSAEDDNADGYSEVTVNVQGGASMTEVANTYGTELVITSAQGSAPSATRHTLYFEFEDETTETEYAYYDDSFISSAITATTPTTRSSKTVTSAQLDGVEWYSYTPPTPSGTWTTLYDDQITAYQGAATIPALSDLYFAENETYRVTIDGTEYVRDTVHFTANGNDMWVVGNPDIITSAVESGDQFVVFNAGWGALYVYFNNEDTRDYTLKLEKKG